MGRLAKLVPSARILLVGVLAAVSAYTWGIHRGKQIERGEQADRAALVADIRDQALAAAAQAISEIRIENTSIQNEIQREVREVPVYLECVNTPDGMQLLQAALRAEPAGAGELSDADTAD